MATALTALIAYIFTYFISKYMDIIVIAPRIKIHYNPKFSHRGHLPIDDSKFQSQCILRLAVENESIYVARGCRVFLAGLERIPNDGPSIETLDEASQLAWSKSNGATSIELPKGIRSYFTCATAEVLLIDKSKKGQSRRMDTWNPEANAAVVLAFQILNQENLIKSFESSTAYRLTLIATAENAEPYTFRCVLQYVLDQHGLRLTVSEMAGHYQTSLFHIFDTLNRDIRGGGV